MHQEDNTLELNVKVFTHKQEKSFFVTAVHLCRAEVVGNE